MPLEFDFDYMCRLAATNPEEFERQRRLLIEDTVVSAPARLHGSLWSTQSGIDAMSKITTNPIDRYTELIVIITDRIDDLLCAVFDLGKDAVDLLKKSGLE
jgi:hypothetical protein